MNAASETVLPVVMAGGSGTRLWPLSRAGFPKQFLALSGEQTLFQSAVLRLARLSRRGLVLEAPCLVGNEEHRFLLLDQLRQVGIEPGAIVLEPAGRNTAPALTLAALYGREAAGAEAVDPIIVVTPADHTIGDPDAFEAALVRAVAGAADGSMVILGIEPTHAETGFGYIEARDPGRGANDLLEVVSFAEKPDAETAQRYLDAGGHYWNSGMFVMRASTWLGALAHFRPDIDVATRAAWDARKRDASFIRPDPARFAEIPGESIDYAVMEPASRGFSGRPIKMVPLDAKWNDLGSWDAVWDASSREADGNSVHGDVLLRGTRDTYVHATSRLVSTIGVEGLVIVETPDAVLVAAKADSQQVKQVVARLAEQGRSEGDLHRRVHRPWGWYDSIDQGERFQVKRILVKPGASLSLQMHHHRAEHWIVVSGTAEVTNGDDVLLLTENQSTYIPVGRRHRLANRGKVPLEIIEVQSGSYLGEDDIVRFEDTYGRTGTPA